MPANEILLLGAGFSRNWNAPLAHEVANSLLQAVGTDAHLQEVLRQHDKNFENALSEIQREFISAPSSPEATARFDILQRAIAGMFERINVSFEPPAPFEFTNSVQYSVAGFLARFDAIFNLNQDMLLELRYAQQVLSASNTRWSGLERFPLFVNRGDSLWTANKILWAPPDLEGGGDGLGVFERSSSSRDPVRREGCGGAGGGTAV